MATTAPAMNSFMHFRPHRHDHPDECGGPFSNNRRHSADRIIGELRRSQTFGDLSLGYTIEPHVPGVGLLLLLLSFSRFSTILAGNVRLSLRCLRLILSETT
jgi:hypothetical protein